MMMAQEVRRDGTYLSRGFRWYDDRQLMTKFDQQYRLISAFPTELLITSFSLSFGLKSTLLAAFVISGWRVRCGHCQVRFMFGTGLLSYPGAAPGVCFRYMSC